MAPVSARGIQDDDERTWRGWWWTPDEPDVRWSGTLRFTPDSGVYLDAYVMREGPRAPGDLRPSPAVGVVHGLSANGQRITLFDCTLWEATANFGADGVRQEMQWRAEVAIIGAHLSRPDELTFDHIQLEMYGLFEWLTARADGPSIYPPAPRIPRDPHYPWRLPKNRPQPTRRRSQMARDARRRDRRRRPHNVRRTRDLLADARYYQPSFVSMQIDAATLSFDLTERRSVSQVLEVKKQTATMSLHLRAPMTLASCEREWIDPLNRLLIFLTVQPVSIEALSCTTLRDSDGAPILTPTLEVLRQRWPERAGGRRGRGFDFILVPRRALGRHLALFVHRWFELDRSLDPAIGVLIGNLIGRQWLENQLLNMMSFAETYHERHHDHPAVDPAAFRRERKRVLKTLDGPMRDVFVEKLAKGYRLGQTGRLRDLLERAEWPVPQLTQFADELVEGLVATRNHLTHFGERGRRVLDDHDLVSALRRLTVVIQTNCCSTSA